MERAIAWSTVAVITVVTVGFIALLQVTTCLDAAPGEGESSCTSGPAVGVPGLWASVVVGAVVVVIAVRNAVVAARRSA